VPPVGRLLVGLLLVGRLLVSVVELDPGTRRRGGTRWHDRRGEREEHGVDISLDGWDIGRFDDIEWVPWGSGGTARAKTLASGDGFFLSVVDARAGYRGDPHEHLHTEFLFVIEGSLRTQGREMTKGDAYIATAGTKHSDFATDAGATYLSIIKI
jgi:quercetin dioxygenase-like cupin family protein